MVRVRKIEGRAGEVEREALSERMDGKTLLEEGGRREGIERELRVVRILPNPRMVKCEYWELAQKRVCVVDVGRNRKYLKGMMFKMREPIGEEEYARPWKYEGKAPRRKGRW
jgi:hypothetical protein